MKKVTAIAPANIAFIKYWGKADANLKIPANASISMNLSGATTTTTVEFSSSYAQDDVCLIDGEFSSVEKAKIIAHLDLIREKSEIREHARVVTKNTFPKGTGIASSASGFAALTLAATLASGLPLTQKELSIIARIGSGSACRSIPDGFVKWEKGVSSDTSYAHSLYGEEYWELCDLLVIVQSREKSVSSTKGMEEAATSPFWEVRVAGIEEKITRLEKALREKNIQEFGAVVEEEYFNMHAVMFTQTPSLLYWNEGTISVLHALRVWQKEGIPVYATIDAGSNVHLICEKKIVGEIKKRAVSLQAVDSLVVNDPAKGAHTIDTHLF